MIELGIVALRAFAQVAALVATIIILVAMEIGRVYVSQAFRDTLAAKVLWLSLMGIIGVALVTFYLVQSPATQATGIYLASWSVFGWIVVIEGADWYQRKHDQEWARREGSNLSDFIGDWNHQPQPAMANGSGDWSYQPQAAMANGSGIH